MKKNLFKYLRGNEYPGRGICIGLCPDGSKAMIVYWIMGRSANSRNRIFEELPERNGIRTVAADPSKMEDPHLIIYNAVRTMGNTTIVTNGNQTDTIHDYIEQNRFPGYAFEAALSGRRFEDDAPNYTPRISGIIDMHIGSYKLGILKSDDGFEGSMEQQTFDYPEPLTGEGHLITTYEKNGSPIPSFAGEPIKVNVIDDDANKYAEAIWESLNPDNKVALFVRAITLSDGSYEDVIINQYRKTEE